MAKDVRYEEIDHTADIRLRVYGAGERELFANAAFALFDKMIALQNVRPSSAREVEAAGGDAEETLVAFLSELLYGYDAEKFVCRECEIGELTPTRVRAICRGETFDPSRHEFKHHIKAVTFHDVRIVRAGGGLEVTLTCDV
jgi:SHS2 domain-containing protein